MGETHTAAWSITLLFGEASTVAAPLAATIEKLPRSVERASRYLAVDRRPGGSRPLAGRDLVVLESTVTPQLRSEEVAGPVLDRLAPTFALEAQGAGPASLCTDSEHTGLLVVLVRNLLAGREGDFLRWYDRVHIPEVLATGTYGSAARLVLAPADAEATGARTMSLWTTDWQDPAAALAALTARSAAMTAWPRTAALHVASYRLCEQATR